MVAQFQGRLDELLAHIDRRVEEARASGEDYDLAQALGHRAAVTSRFLPGPAVDDTVVADAHEALSLARRVGSPTTLSVAALCAGSVGWVSPEEALGYLTQSIEAAESVGNQFLLGGALSAQGARLVQLGDVSGAAVVLGRAIDEQYRIGDQAVITQTLGVAVILLEAAGDTETAATLNGFERESQLRVQLVLGMEHLVAAEHALEARLGSQRAALLRQHGRAMTFDQIATVAAAALDRIAAAPLPGPKTNPSRH